MKNLKLRNLCFSILICVFVMNVMATSLVHAAPTISGVQRFGEGIAAYEHGEYDDAIFKLEMAVYQIPEGENDDLWDAHFYRGLSYYLTGDNEEAMKEFVRASEIFKGKIPDPDTHSPKIVKLFKEAVVIKKPVISGSANIAIVEDLLNEAIQLYREEEFEEAIAKWEKVLALDPSKLEAKFNIEIAQDRIEEQRIQDRINKGR